jgi:rRNA maturation RNase YbeY
MRGAVRYFTEGIVFRLSNPLKTKRWLIKVAQSENQAIGNINYIFCSDKYLMKINRQFLRHRSLTDIITFQYHSKGQPLEGDIFISIQRVRDNAKKFKVDITDELHRVMVHGLLHLMGYADKTPAQKRKMRKKESTCLSLR